MKKILVTGANGQLGNEMRLLAKEHKDFVPDVQAVWCRHGVHGIRIERCPDSFGREDWTRNLEDLEIPVVVTATDFDHGQCVHFTRGEIARRVAASCCIPVLFAPVKIGGTYYVDGGVFMNVPVTPIRDMCDKVLALNVYKLVADEYSKNLAAIALRAYHFMFQANTFTELEKADLVIAPDGLGSYSNYELEKAEEIFSAGYFAASKVLEGLEEDEKERYFSFR